MKVAFVTQTRPTKWQKTSASCSTFREKIELKEYTQEDYDSMLVAQHQELYELQKKARLIRVRKPQKAAEL